ncbi:MAG: anti-sigma factor family protein [bacterium]
MNHHIAAESLSAYLDGALPPVDMQAAAQHLAECMTCRRELETLQQASALLREQPPYPVPPFFAARLANKISSHRMPSLSADFVWLGIRLVPALAVLLAIVLIWAPFESAEPLLDENDYLSAAGAGSAMSLLAENSAAMTKEEILELVVLSSPSVQE